MRIVSFFIIAVLAATSARADDWPKVPFTPRLTVVADGSEALCTQYQHRVRADYFAEHPGFSAVEGRNELEPVENTPMEKVLGVTELEYPPPVFRGNVDGDDQEDMIVLRSMGGSNNVDYRNYFYVLRLGEADISWLRQALEAGDKSDSQVWHSFFKHRAADRMERARKYRIGRSAYPLLDTFRILSHDGRLYADVLRPRNWNEKRVLLSFDHELAPKTECVVAVKTPLDPHIQAFFHGTRFSQILAASAQIAGRRTRCPSGSSKPFLYKEVAKWLFLHEALFRPWRVRSKLSRWSRKLDQYDQWSFNGYQYFWSLQGAVNRKSYQAFEQHSAEAAAGLAAYYRRNFGIDDKRAAGIAKAAVNFIRQQSSASGEYYFAFHGIEFDALLAASEGRASADDFFSIARAYVRPYSINKSEMPAKEVLDRSALNLALRLAASADASPEVLGALVERGARVGYGIESNLMVAVDLGGPRRFLLKHGADPNRPNYFGKTPLMMAAHMNSPAAVRDLLAAGAKVEARTYKVLPGEDDQGWKNEDWRKSCEYVLKFRNRTALMYAAENASPEIIRLLLKSGADASAVDSGGRGVLDYLSRNPILADTERRKAERLLRKAGAVQ